MAEAKTSLLDEVKALPMVDRLVFVLNLMDTAKNKAQVEAGGQVLLTKQHEMNRAAKLHEVAVYRKTSALIAQVFAPELREKLATVAEAANG